MFSINICSIYRKCKASRINYKFTCSMRRKNDYNLLNKKLKLQNKNITQLILEKIEVEKITTNATQATDNPSIEGQVKKIQ